jgi:Zinc knuckle
MLALATLIVTSIIIFIIKSLRSLLSKWAGETIAVTEDVEISRPLARLRIRTVCIEEQSEDASCDLQHLDGICPDPHFDYSRQECHVNVKHPHFEPIKCCLYYWAGTSSVEDEEQALPASEDPNHQAKNSLAILQARGRCYKCYEEGHMARSCPKRKKKKAHPYKPKVLSYREKNCLQNEGWCFICQKQGHLARVCPLQCHSLSNRMGDQEDEEDRWD